MTEILNPKQLAYDSPAADLDIVIWNLFVIWCLLFVIFGLSVLDICNSNFSSFFRFIRVREIRPQWVLKLPESDG